MPQRSMRIPPACTRTCRIAGVLVFALLLAGCDRCGDFFFPKSPAQQSCRDDGPRQR